MYLRVHVLRNVELSEKLPPSQEFPPEGGAEVESGRKVHEPESPLVTTTEGLRSPCPGKLQPTVHLVPDHENLLVQVETGPVGIVQARVLGHDTGSPFPINLWVRACSRSRISSSSITMLRLPWEGRMLISEVYSMQSEDPNPG